ncbi:AmmeMemoRadiSam system protein B [archaeon]|nr:AmmeMemoRadiSam system protein B [archaeon]
MIKPQFAGQFYESDFEKLSKQIEHCYTGDLGPGDLPTKRTEKITKGIILPHARYTYSGQCAAWAYKEIAESKFPKTFIILFPDHTGTHFDYATTLEDFETMLGVVQVDKEFIEKLLKTNLVKKTTTIKEHSIEVQLPFLQVSNKDKMNEIKIVPIICPTTNNYKELAQEIAKISNDICIIISSDFTHYGPKFGYTPFKFNIKQSIKDLDKNAIELILNYKSKEFLKYVKKTKATICGQYPIALGLEILKQINSENPELLCYYNSNKIMPNESQVSYASISFR